MDSLLNSVVFMFSWCRLMVMLNGELLVIVVKFSLLLCVVFFRLKILKRVLLYIRYM